MAVSSFYTWNLFPDSKSVVVNYLFSMKKFFKQYTAGFVSFALLAAFTGSGQAQTVVIASNAADANQCKLVS
jgi:hypothetical protein